MIDILKDILTYISGLWTLPWIIIGFIITILLAKLSSREKIDKIMRKIGLVLLYFFIPFLVFRIFLDYFEEGQIIFVIVVSIIIFLMYIITYFYAKYFIKKEGLSGSKKNLYLKTVLTNQGRSSAFIGSVMMAYWKVEAGIFIALVGVALFAIIPYMLSYIHKKEMKNSEKKEEIKALPWFLRLYPWYLILFIITAIAINMQMGISTRNLGDFGVVFTFYTAITIPAALYYVGAGIYPSDLKISEIKKILGITRINNKGDHWKWVRNIFILTVIVTPLTLAVFLTPLLIFKIIPKAWFAIIIINAVLPITSTNMFLLPYGIDKKTTSHVITWTTVVCVPIAILLIFIFGIYL
jgi:hypothetical protein